MKIYNLTGRIKKSKDLIYNVGLFGEIDDPKSLKGDIDGLMNSLDVENEGKILNIAMRRIMEHLKKMDRFITLYDLKLERKNESMKLTIVLGGKRREFIVENGGRITIGRSRDNDFKVEDEFPQISRHHCTLIFKDGKLYVEDMGSRNGTFIYGEKREHLEPHRLRVLRENEKIILANLEMDLKVERIEYDG